MVSEQNGYKKNSGGHFGEESDELRNRIWLFIDIA